MFFFIFKRKDIFCFFFFFQAEDGIRAATVTGVQTCALPIFHPGEHTSVIDPTGNGKTYLATRGLLPALWRDYPVILIYTKGDDETLGRVGHKVGGFPMWFEKAGRKLPWYRVVIPTT